LDKPRSPQKTKLGFLALALALGFLLVSVPSSTLPVHAWPTALYVMINSASYGTLGSYNVVKANLTNPFSFPQKLIVFAIWKNSASQTVAVSTGGFILSSSATQTNFAPLTNALPSGLYAVNVFVITTNNNPVSSTLSFVVAI
jgi:hypothetical protein